MIGTASRGVRVGHGWDEFDQVGLRQHRETEDWLACAARGYLPPGACHIDTPDGRIGLMPAIPESTKTSLAQRLRQHARHRWPQLAGLHVRYHGQFAYVEGELADGHHLPLIRLRYGGSASIWGFGLYLASSGKYENQILVNRQSCFINHL
ncbi:hypothetical protein AB0J35_42965 [Nonomuraea angiospora]|uniref:hypothetical protein n=1 Tax=Nonomuraea angiospora TaxID=46172 RepID=UPI003418F91E